MTTILIGFFTMILVLISAFCMLIILMQRASSNAGLGSALGGGAAESAFGGGASSVLTRGTVYGSAAFFVVAFGLYLAHMSAYEGEIQSGATLLKAEAIAVEEESAGPSALEGALTNIKGRETMPPASELEAPMTTNEAVTETAPLEGTPAEESAMPVETPAEAEEAAANPAHNAE